MDQENTKGQEKRNWRERLGIGAQGGKDLPRISDDFRKDAPAASGRPIVPARPAPRPAAAAVKPAPMAPRANPKAINPSPVSPDKLAERLRSQREATTRMADQRVQVAKQRADASAPAPQPASAAPPPQPAKSAPAAKPKFSFAEEGGPQASVAVPQRPAAVAPPPPPAQPAPQLAPARPPLGAGPATQQPPAFQTRPNTPPAYQSPPAQAYPQGAVPPNYAPGYGAGPVPPYRPIDPMTGYPAQPGYVPQQPGRGFGGPGQQGGYMPPNGPRLNVPQRTDIGGKSVAGLNPNYPPSQDYGVAPQPGFGPNPRLTRPSMRGPAGPALPQDGYEDDGYDEVPTPRASRPNSTDYQQAYREAEYGYEDEEPRSKTPWILAGLLLLTLLVATLGVWLYQSTWKPMMNGQTATQEVPAVAAPETPAKVETEATANNAPATAPAVSTPTKKQIYDRIVGDQEVLGGDVGAPAETPAAIPEPNNADGVAPAPAGSGDDPAPLPIPPPPGDQQGSLDPASEKQSSEVISPAAGESQAAVAAQDGVDTAANAPPPTPGEVAEPPLKTRGFDDPPAVGEVAETEAVEDTPPETPVKKAPVKKLKPKAKRVADKKLGGKPVVLVAPGKNRQAANGKIKPLTADDDAVAADGGLYGSTDITASVAAPEVSDAPPKKRRTLADLFKSSNEPKADEAQVATVEPTVPTAPKKLVAPQPKPEVARQVGGGGYVVQLASFRSRAEATTEFGRLKARHGGALGPYSPIITEAVVGGSTRYRLSVGSMPSQSQASAVCSSLFAKGERDCLVKKL
jgi:SPOR domain